MQHDFFFLVLQWFQLKSVKCIISEHFPGNILILILAWYMGNAQIGEWAQMQREKFF